MKLAKVFLSHASQQAPFVEKVAVELGRRGVVPWVDRDRVAAGMDLPTALRAAVQDHAVVAVFLTADAAASSWVDHELSTALEQTRDEAALVIPVCDGDPQKLIERHPLLQRHWLNEDGRVSVRWIDLQARVDEVSPEAFAASELARQAYSSIGTRTNHKVAIWLDQRAHGNARRWGEPTAITEAIRRMGAPVLVFRPDRGRYSDAEVLYGPHWDEVVRGTIAALSEAIPARGAGPLHVYLAGDAQLGWPFLFGYRYFDRRCKRRLVCHNPEDGQRFEFDFGQDALPAGDASHGTWKDGPPTDRGDVAIYLGKPGTYEDDVLRELADRGRVPLFRLYHGRRMAQADVLQIIADTLAVIQQHHSSIDSAYLFCDLPFGAMPLLGAHLAGVLDGAIRFMEYRRDLHGPLAARSSRYVPLSMREDS